MHCTLKTACYIVAMVGMSGRLQRVAILTAVSINPRGAFVALRALAISFLGGALLHVLGFPAAWLSGGMIATAIASLRGVPMDVPPVLRSASMLVLGLSIGTAVTPSTLASLPQWPVSMACLLLSVVLVQLATQFFFTRVAGWSRATAFFAAVPGALNFVMAAAGGTRADVRLVAIAQTVRLFVLIAALPLLLVFFDLGSRAGQTPAVLPAGQLALLVVAGLAAGGALALLKVPVALLMGSMLSSAILYGGGWVEGTVPAPLLTAALVVLAAFVGGRFSGTSVAQLRQAGIASLGGFAVSLAVAAVLALVTALIANQPVGSVLLAFAPGGLDTMSILALALQLDGAFVATHHLARFIGISLALPLAVRWLALPADEGVAAEAMAAEPPTDS